MDKIARTAPETLERGGYLNGHCFLIFLECCDFPSAPEWYRLGLDLPTSIAPG